VKGAVWFARAGNVWVDREKGTKLIGVRARGGGGGGGKTPGAGSRDKVGGAGGKWHWLSERVMT